MQLTYQTRIYLKDPTSPSVAKQDKNGSSNEAEANQLNKIVEAMTMVGKFYRFCFNNFWFNQGLTYLELKNKDFCNQFKLGTKQANSLIREAKAKVELYREMYNYSENVLISKLKILKKEEVKLTKLIAKIEKLTHRPRCKHPKTKPCSPNSPFKLTYEYYLTRNKAERKQFYQTLKRLIWHNKRKQENTQKSLNRLNNPSITFGSKEKQRLLSKGKITIEQWRELRNNFIFGLGESDVSCGNNTIKVFSQTKVQVEVLNLEKIVLNCKIRNKHYNKIKDETKRTARLIRKNGKFYLQSIVDFSKEINQIKNEVNKLKESECNYCGIDLNDGFFSVYSPYVWKNYHYDKNFKQYNSHQREQNLRQLIKQMFADITKEPKVNIHVVRIEDLDFMKLKHKDKSKTMNKMIHELPYGLFRKLIEVESFNHQMTVELIDPAYTSKKALEMGLDRHLGAAKIIAEGGVCNYVYNRRYNRSKTNGSKDS
jgi:transposase, IS605 orfB family